MITLGWYYTDTPFCPLKITCVTCVCVRVCVCVHVCVQVLYLWIVCSYVAIYSGVASLDLMLGHTSSYKTPCLIIASLATSMLVYMCIHSWLLFEKCIVRLAMAMLV